VGYCRVTDDEGGARDPQEEAEQQQFQSCLSQLDGYFKQKMIAESGERTSAMEDEAIIWRIPHVAEDSAKRGPARVEDLRI
jgi:hypothetical protein